MKPQIFNSECSQEKRGKITSRSKTKAPYTLPVWMASHEQFYYAKFVFDKLYKIILECVINFVKLFPGKCPCSGNWTREV